MQAGIYIDHQQAPLAEQPLHEALMIRKKINDPFYIVYDMSSLAAYYAANNQPQKGIRLGVEGVALGNGFKTFFTVAHDIPGPGRQLQSRWFKR